MARTEPVEMVDRYIRSDESRLAFGCYKRSGLALELSQLFYKLI
jgi:hypothetical protein